MMGTIYDGDHPNILIYFKYAIVPPDPQGH
jgi:hypothetical protein